MVVCIHASRTTPTQQLLTKQDILATLFDTCGGSPFQGLTGSHMAPNYGPSVHEDMVMPPQSPLVRKFPPFGGSPAGSGAGSPRATPPSSHGESSHVPLISSSSSSSIGHHLAAGPQVVHGGGSGEVSMRTPLGPPGATAALERAGGGPERERERERERPPSLAARRERKGPASVDLPGRRPFFEDGTTKSPKAILAATIASDASRPRRSSLDSESASGGSPLCGRGSPSPSPSPSRAGSASPSSFPPSNLISTPSPSNLSRSYSSSSNGGGGGNGSGSPAGNHHGSPAQHHLQQPQQQQHRYPSPRALPPPGGRVQEPAAAASSAAGRGASSPRREEGEGWGSAPLLRRGVSGTIKESPTSGRGDAARDGQVSSHRDGQVSHWDRPASPSPSPSPRTSPGHRFSVSGGVSRLPPGSVSPSREAGGGWGDRGEEQQQQQQQQQPVVIVRDVSSHHSYLKNNKEEEEEEEANKKLHVQEEKEEEGAEKGAAAVGAAAAGAAGADAGMGANASAGVYASGPPEGAGSHSGLQSHHHRHHHPQHANGNGHSHISRDGNGTGNGHVNDNGHSHVNGNANGHIGGNVSGHVSGNGGVGGDGSGAKVEPIAGGGRGGEHEHSQGVTNRMQEHPSIARRAAAAAVAAAAAAAAVLDIACSGMDLGALGDAWMTQTPLHVAVASNQVEAAQLLLQWEGPEQPELEARNMNGMTPLHLAVWSAARSEDTSAVEVLLEHRADLSALDKDKKTPINQLARAPSTEKLLSLLNRHLDQQSVATAQKAVENAKAKMAELEAELAHIVGLTQLKEQLRRWCKGLLLDQKRRSLGVKVQPRQAPHMAFLGSPGTGKTSVARIMAKLLHMVGVLAADKVTEVQRTDLVGEFVGHTGPKTRKKIEEAEGGILFVDEAYRLMPAQKADDKDYGAEALEEIMSVMDSGRIVVIFAGYAEPMQRVFGANEGFQRRVTKYFTFDDMTALDIARVVHLQMARQSPDSPLHGFRLSADCSEVAIAALLEERTTELQRKRRNGGLALPLLLDARDHLDSRLDLDCCQVAELVTLQLDDVSAAVDLVPRD
eukprot:jgi/Mesen1/8465/ME000478S07959